MPSLGENRLKIYNLLYNKPLFDYMQKDNDGNQEINVLILGNGWVGNEAFKAVFWCGQYPDTKLNITIASENAKDYEVVIKETLPALKRFANFNGENNNKKSYANIFIKNVSFEKIIGAGITEDVLDENCLNLNKQSYIIVALGDEETNFLVAESIAQQIRPSYKKVLINIYAESYLCDFPCDSNIEINSFGGETTNADNLERIAKNINFLYTTKYDCTANKNEINQAFDEEYINEFITSPTQTEGDLFESIKNFIGGKYNVDSSYANAVHSKYKLAFCKQETKSTDVVSTFVSAINSKNTLYNRLLELEHRRWNAFMAMRGYRLPEVCELGYLYNGKNTHKNDEELLHICMCECDSNGIKLHKYSSFWKEDKIPEELCELDRVSLYCNKILTEKTKNLKVQTATDIEFLKNVKLNSLQVTASINEFANAALKLVNNDENAVVFYNLAYEKVVNSLTNNKEILSKIKSVDSKLQLAKERNLKKDFFSYDAELLDMLPLALWLGEKYKTVITFSSMQATEDVIVPWMLIAEKVTFIMPKGSINISEYQKNIRAFFEKQGNNTQIAFSEVSFENINDICNKIDTIFAIDNDIVINIPKNSCPEIAMSVNKYLNDIPVVSFSKTIGVKCFNQEQLLPFKPRNNKWTVNEYFEMINGTIKNPYSSEIPYINCQPLEDFFWDNNVVKSYGEVPKIKLYNDWNSVLIKDFLQKKTFNRYRGNEYVNLPFDQNDIYATLKSEFLKHLSNERVIENLYISKSEHIARFSVCNKEIYDLLSVKGGAFFELLVYYKILYTGLLNDVQTGIEFMWGNVGDDFVLNEIDVVAMNGITPIFISCKTNPSIDNGFIYEIASEANRFGGIGILATSQDLSNKDNYNHRAVVRANATGVAIIDAHILRNDKLLSKAIKQILEGKYKGPENFA